MMAKYITPSNLQNTIISEDFYQYKPEDFDSLNILTSPSLHYLY